MPIDFFDPENVYAIFSQQDYVTRRHAHYVLEVVCASAGTFKIETPRQTYHNLSTVIIPPNKSHSFSCIGATCNLLFLDPLSPIGRYFMQRYRLNSEHEIIADLPEFQLFHWHGKFNIDCLLEKAAQEPVEDLDSRLVGCIQKIDELCTAGNISLSELSKHSFLSEGRLSHLFKSSLGISIHQYILWRKIISAISRSRSGYSITDCAHAVGFFDSSHFNKVFMKTFGIKPSFVLKD